MANFSPSLNFNPANRAEISARAEIRHVIVPLITLTVRSLRENLKPRPTVLTNFSENGYFEKVPWLRLVTCLSMPTQAAQRVGIKTFFMESSTVIARAQRQRNASAAQFVSLEFFVRRLEEYERTLSVLTTRIEESYIQEITLFGLYLNRLLGILNE